MLIVETTVLLTEEVLCVLLCVVADVGEVDVAIVVIWFVEVEELELSGLVDWDVTLWLAVSAVVVGVASVVAVAVTLESRLICNIRKNRTPVGQTDEGQKISVTTRAFIVFACG